MHHKCAIHMYKRILIFKILSFRRLQNNMSLSRSRVLALSYCTCSFVYGELTDLLIEVNGIASLWGTSPSVSGRSSLNSAGFYCKCFYIITKRIVVIALTNLIHNSYQGLINPGVRTFHWSQTTGIRYKFAL